MSERTSNLRLDTTVWTGGSARRGGCRDALPARPTSRAASRGDHNSLYNWHSYKNWAEKSASAGKTRNNRSQAVSGSGLMPEIGLEPEFGRTILPWPSTT